MSDNISAINNRTITLNRSEMKEFSERLLLLKDKVDLKDIANRTINQDMFEAIKYLPDGFVDLLFLDPPYNRYKNFNDRVFKKKNGDEYSEYLESFIPELVRLLKPTASIYICGDWHSSASIYFIAEKYFNVRNRITWEREKGRGSKNNWKNNTEDIWYCTMSNDFVFNADAVKLKRRVLAPYKENGKPKDWEREDSGLFRLTFSSNIWTDITVPFWSMRENTAHPTQKPEKLMAKIILASTNPGQFVFDPFAGSGTTAVASKKLGRNFLSIEIDKEYACIIEKRLELAETDKRIQGFQDNVFWERNTLSFRKRTVK